MHYNANRVHCILFFLNDNYNLNKIVSNGKRFIAYEIMKRLEQQGLTKILLHLKECSTERDVAKGQKHKVFEESFDAKRIYHRKFLIQR